MRRVILEDVVALARALQGVAPVDRERVALAAIERAHLADKARKRSVGRAEPGDLAFHARSFRAAPLVLGVTALDCLTTAARAIAEWKRAQAARGGGRGLLAAMDGNPRGLALSCAKHQGDPMQHPRHELASVDPVWDRVTREGREAVAAEPLLGGLVHACILHHASLETALAYRIAQKLASGEMSEQLLREIADEAFRNDAGIGAAARADIVAVFDRDPACHRFLQPILYFKGFQAVQAYRIGHWLWRQGRNDLAYFIQMRVSEVFGVDIHPGARIGKGIMIDHAHSIVIGETAVVGDNVSMLHSVTLGGTGKVEEDRHPKIGNGVLIGAGAKVLGNIRIGNCSKIAAGSVVLADVPDCKTVAGVPARIIGEAGCDQPSMNMDHLLPGAGSET